jgi:hypothetical protein
MGSFRHCFVLLALVVLAYGCESRSEQPPPPDITKAFSNLPLPPDPVLVSRAGSGDALQLTVHTPAAMDQVLEYYRGVLSNGNWRLISDSKNADGSAVLYAEQNGPPLWVRIWKLGDRGTMVELTGAVVEAKKTKHQGPPPTAKPK